MAAGAAEVTRVEKRTIRRLRGATALVTDAVDAAATEVQRVHEAIARRPYLVLSRIAPMDGPVKAIESVQVAITAVVYGAVRAFNGIAGDIASRVIDRLEVDPTFFGMGARHGVRVEPEELKEGLGQSR